MNNSHLRYFVLNILILCFCFWFEPSKSSTLISSFIRGGRSRTETDLQHLKFSSFINQITSVLKNSSSESEAKSEDDITDLSERYYDWIKQLNSLNRNNLSVDLVLNLVNSIWNEIKNNNHNHQQQTSNLSLNLFKEVVSWAIQVISKNHRQFYWKLVEFAINENIYPELYVQILRKSVLMSHEDVHRIVKTLYSKFLIISQDRDQESFNSYFLELALSYPNFSSLPFISTKTIPDGFVCTPILDVIYVSTEFIEIFRTNTNQPQQQQSVNLEKLQSILNRITRIILDSDLDVSCLAEELSIIFDSEHFGFINLSRSDQEITLNFIFDQMRYIILIRELYPEVVNESMVDFAFLIENNYKTLLVKYLDIFQPQFTVEEYVYFLNLADKKHLEDPDCLLTLFEKVQTSKDLWLYKQKYFHNSSIRLHCFIDIINSIHRQFPATYVASTKVRSEEYSRMLHWRLPECLMNNLSYDYILSTADVLAIPLLFISIVFSYDFRNSTALEKYKKNGKPLRNQLTRIINEIVEEEVRKTLKSYPKFIVKVVDPKFISLPLPPSP